MLQLGTSCHCLKPGFEEISKPPWKCYWMWRSLSLQWRKWCRQRDFFFWLLLARLVSGTQRIPNGTEMVSLIGLLICRRLELWISTSSLVFEARHFSEAQTDYGERCCAVSFCYWQSWLGGGTWWWAGSICVTARAPSSGWILRLDLRAWRRKEQGSTAALAPPKGLSWRSLWGKRVKVNYQV